MSAVFEIQKWATAIVLTHVFFHETYFWYRYTAEDSVTKTITPFQENNVIYHCLMLSGIFCEKPKLYNIRKNDMMMLVLSLR